VRMKVKVEVEDSGGVKKRRKEKKEKRRAERIHFPHFSCRPWSVRGPVSMQFGGWTQADKQICTNGRAHLAF